MTVILNEAALAAFLESSEGPVGQFVRNVAASVAAAAQQNVRAYFVIRPVAGRGSGRRGAAWTARPRSSASATPGRNRGGSPATGRGTGQLASRSALGR